MKIQGYTLQQQYQIQKERLDHTLDSIADKIRRQRTTKENDESYGLYIEPLVPVWDTRFLWLRSTILRKVTDIQSRDAILNSYTLSDAEEDDTRFNMFWNDYNKYQLYLAGKEFFTYGFAALELIFNDLDEVKELHQIPAYTIRIKKEQYSINQEDQVEFYYLEQEVNNITTILRLTHKDYSLLDDNNILDDSEGYALWIGNGSDSDWYELPQWVQARDSIHTAIQIDELNNQKVHNGNIPAAVMLFDGPTQFVRDNEEPIEEKLKHDLRGGGAGTVFSYIESPSSEQKINMNYVKLEDENYSYLQGLKDDALNSLLNVYEIPKIRLMIDDVKESMNSNKSDTIYELYNKTIIFNQAYFKQVLNKFNHQYLDVTSDLVISLPEFVEKTNNRVDIIINLFDKGLFTLELALQGLSEIFPDMTLELDQENPEQLISRYYNGKLLGSEDSITTEDQAFEDITKEFNNRFNKITGDDEIL